MQDDDKPDSRDIEPEIAADDVGASAAAERMQKEFERLPDAAAPLPAQGDKEAAGSPTEAADELLVDGQEEVFSRSEIESGRIEHHVGEEPVSGRAGEEKKNQAPQSPG